MKLFFTCIVLISSIFGFSQKSLDKLLAKHNHNNIPYVSVSQLHATKNQVVLLDTREPNEFETSHIKQAINVGYTLFNIETIKDLLPENNTPIVVYCSLGIRSEQIASKLKQAGYTNVKNLYGGIFEWKNHNFPVYNSNKKETDSVHVYSKTWKKWLKKGIGVYE